MKPNRPSARSCMAVVSLQIILAAILFVLYYRAQYWAKIAYDFHRLVRCGSDLDELNAHWQRLEATHHSEALMVRNIMRTEKRKCLSEAYFHTQFYTACMGNGFWVLQVYPMMTSMIQASIVWFLQRGPLTEKTFQKPAFVICLMSSLILLSLNVVNLLTSCLCLSEIKLTDDNDCGNAACGMESISSLISSLTSGTIAMFIVLAYMSRLRHIDNALEELRVKDLRHTSQDDLPFLAGVKPEPGRRVR